MTLSALHITPFLKTYLIQSQGTPQTCFGDLCLYHDKIENNEWAQNIWHDCQYLEFQSINDAAKKLKSIQRNWVLYPLNYFQRSQLIQHKLPPIKASPIVFPNPILRGKLGAWTLLEPNLILYSTQTSSPFPNGIPVFQENQTIAPNRAYLKLWEILSLGGFYPQAHDICIDLGSSPGGWTWVLQTLNAHVISIDKAPLAKPISRLDNIQYQKKSAFAINPHDFSQATWLFSDIACYPERLLKLIQKWQSFNPSLNIIATLKLQGSQDLNIIQQFKNFPNSRLIHLFYNKHELTWIYSKKSEFLQQLP